MKKQSHKTAKPEVIETPVVSEASTVPAKIPMPKPPMKLAIKRETLIRTGIILLALLVAIPVFDWIIQTSITAKYAAFYKSNDVTRATYVKRLEEEYGTTVMQQLLIESTVYEAAKAKGIVVSDTDIKTAIDATKKANNITTDEQYKQALATSRITESQYIGYQRLNLTIEKLFGPDLKAPTEKELKDFFAANSTQYTGKKYEEVKDQVAKDQRNSALQEAEGKLVTAELQNYDSTNILADPANASYKFLRSIDLVKKLFSNNPNTK